jgi:hypothetical protein
MRWLALALMAAASFPVAAQDVREVAASVPSDRSVTIYRAPRRNGGQLTLSSLGGFAVITETREVDLPAGEARLAFEGVPDGVVAESAIVTGLPGGVIEKNRDDALLSPSALMRAAVGRDVQLQRVDRKSGKASVTAARILSASDQGVIFATADGQEALRCSGLAEQFRYSGGSEGLFAQPTLSVLTRTSRPLHAVVKLTYIAENFDWNANYIAHIGHDGKTLNLTGWMTLANGNGVSLANARTQIVAGGLNRAYLQRFINDQPRVIARCWPTQNTSDIPETPGRPYELVRPWLGEHSGPLAKDIIVTVRRLDYAAPAAAPPPPPPEQLGDLKLYRVPQRTTIAARQMKQTRLIDQSAVPFETWYRMDVPLSPRMASWVSSAATILLRTTNDTAHHLGLPLPAGAMLVEQDQDNRVMLLGESGLRDTAEGEPLDLALGSAPDITCAWTRLPVLPGDRSFHLRVTLTNGSPHPASIELRLNAFGAWSIDPASIDAPLVDGVPTARLTLASGEKRQLTVTLAAK